MEDVQKLFQKAVSSAFDESIDVVLTRPDEKFGDYATNVALQLANKLGKNPRDVAQKLIESVPVNDKIKSLEVAGPGFINITLTDKALWADVRLEPQKSLVGKTVVAEYSDPNPFKVLHAGHLYTSLVGDAIANLLEAAGADVKRVNFGGDVGLHVAKAMWAILQELGGEHPERLEKVPESLRPDWISECYVKGNTAYEEDEQAKAEIIELNTKIYDLHSKGDKESNFAKIYWACRQWSYDGFDVLYKELSMAPFDKYYPESQTTPIGIKTVKEGLEKGVFQKSEGAIVFKGEDHGLHTRVFLNSNGLPTYEAKDLGLAQQKWQDYNFDISIMITGNDIVEYMKVVLTALKNFRPEITERTRHLTHGMVKLAGGVKMSSRKGNTLKGSDIISAAEQALRDLDRKPDHQTVLAAVKYAFLKSRIGGDIIYDPKESIALEGNSGPYLQYAHARARSILAKSGKKPTDTEGYKDDERSLVRKLGEYQQSVSNATTELMPHHICTYLYELAQNFNRFYEKNRIIGNEREAQRLKLVETYADVLKNGLTLLGIPSPDSM